MSADQVPSLTSWHHVCIVGMEGESHFLFGEACIESVRGDYVKVPFLYTTSTEVQPYHFTSWMVPLTIFWQVALCGNTSPLPALIHAVQQHC